MPTRCGVCFTDWPHTFAYLNCVRSFYERLKTLANMHTLALNIYAHKLASRVKNLIEFFGQRSVNFVAKVLDASALLSQNDRLVKVGHLPFRLCVYSQLQIGVEPLISNARIDLPYQDIPTFSLANRQSSIDDAR